MRGKESKDSMKNRRDGFLAENSHQKKPSLLDLSVSYLGKSRIQYERLGRQRENRGITTMQQLNDKASMGMEQKMRYATLKNESIELDRHRAQGLKVHEGNLTQRLPLL